MLSHKSILGIPTDGSKEILMLCTDRSRGKGWLYPQYALWLCQRWAAVMSRRRIRSEETDVHSKGKGRSEKSGEKEREVNVPGGAVGGNRKCRERRRWFPFIIFVSCRVFHAET
jgi:hypothetical protein